jgi:hypothetical protein
MNLGDRGKEHVGTATERQMEERGHVQSFELAEIMLVRTFGKVESFCVTDTYQFDDYSKYVARAFDSDKQAATRKEVFPMDCEKAYNMGMQFVKESFTVSGKQIKLYRLSFVHSNFLSCCYHPEWLRHRMFTV